MAPCREELPKGSLVRIRDRGTLERFKTGWKYHHKLSSEQLEYAGREAKVIDIGYYHDGDVLYTLEGIPGIWNEECLLGDWPKT